MLFEHLVWLLVFNLVLGRQFVGANQYTFVSTECLSHCCMCHLPESIISRDQIYRRGSLNDETFPNKMLGQEKSFETLHKKYIHQASLLTCTCVSFIQHEAGPKFLPGSFFPLQERRNGCADKVLEELS